jgi:dTDP-glucose 4,6-dehydratase
MAGKNVPIYGNGRNTREWVFVEDNIQGIHNALLFGKSGEIYNLGSGHEYTNIDLFEKICHLGMFDSTLIEFVSDRKGHDMRYSINFEKARNELRYEPTLDFDLSLSTTINWYKTLGSLG